MWAWVGRRLQRKFLVGTAAVALACALVFLGFYNHLFQQQLDARARSEAGELGRLLQVAFERVMLTRDQAGMREIIERLAREPGIREVMVLNADGEVRYAGDPARVGRKLDAEACPECLSGEPASVYRQLGRDVVLRSVLPVRNGERCVSCHGAVETRPLTGLLVVDHEASVLVADSRASTLAAMGGGATLALIVLGGGVWFMRRHVLRPVAQLAHQSRAIAAGDLEARVDLGGQDEFAALGQTFNAMAGRLQHAVVRVRDDEAFVRDVLDALPEGVRVIDSDYRVLEANRAYRRMLGLNGNGAATPATCFAMSFGRSDPCPPTQITCPLHELARDEGPVKALHQLRAANGATVSVELHAAALPKRGLIVESVRELTRDVHFAQEQRMAELGRIAAGVAHEVQNPLTSIRFALQTARREFDSRGANPDELREYLALVDGEIGRCVDLTQRLQKLAARPDGPPQPVALNPAVSETLELLAWEAQQRGVRVTLVLDPGDPRTLGHEADLRLVVLNLVQNAFQAMPDGGELECTTQRVGRWVLLRVRDTGSGIAAADMQRVFEPFYSRRADGSPGAGLGLPIARVIAEQCGGTLTAESRPGAGAIFTLRLPQVDARLRDTL